MSQVVGILPFQWLHHAVREGWIRSPHQELEERQVQSASLDLRLGPVAYRIRSSFLPGHESVQKKLEALTMYDRNSFIRRPIVF
jgi:dCTP deaminase